jgi:hypothetical protein
MISFAKSELEKLDLEETEKRVILKIVETFANSDQSGSSACYAIDIINRLLCYKPLTPLTGEDDEWVEVYTEVYQSKRCPYVFKNKDEAYILESNGMKTPITFPYEVK